MWKSENQGHKEETLIQTGRKDRDGQVGQRGLMATWWLVGNRAGSAAARRPHGSTFAIDGQLEGNGTAVWQLGDRQCGPTFAHR